MRLIDADAVLDFLQIIPIDLGYREIEDVENFVKEMPTIEERKTGRWIQWAKGRVMCSICREEPFHGKGADRLDFCPNCGAKMEVEHD